MPMNIDNVKIENNTVSTLNTNGDLILKPNGSGEVIVPAPVSATSATQKTYVDQQISTNNFLLMGG
jgi:DNA-binding beta-propeller fold protein YncE